MCEENWLFEHYTQLIKFKISYKYYLSNSLPYFLSLGLSSEQARRLESKRVVVACNNAKDSVTISGGKSAVEEIVKDYNEKGFFAKLVNTNGIAFHSDDLKVVEEPYGLSLKPVCIVQNICRI